MLRPSPVAASALLHLLLVAAVLLVFRERPPEEAFVPPSSFAVVFQHGGARHASAPKAPKRGAPEKTNIPIPIRPAPPEIAQAATPAPPKIATVTPPRPMPPRAASLPRPAPPLALPEPPPAAPLPPSQFAVRLPPPTASTSSLHATLTPPERAARVRRPLPPRPVPSPARPARRSPRYLVMNRTSFGDPPSASANPTRGLNLALNRSVMNGAISNTFQIEGQIGPDWRAELTAWVNARKYYPRAAAEMNEQGAVAIRFVVTSDGKVVSVALVQSSGSPFLDEAWLDLFQDANLPPFPPGTKAKQLTIRATMHYILID